jgi:hypothetical protein
MREKIKKDIYILLEKKLTKSEKKELDTLLECLRSEAYDAGNSN